MHMHFNKISGYITFIHTYTGSVVQYQLGCTSSQSIWRVLGSAWFLCWTPLFIFFGFTKCILLYDNKTNNMMLVTISFRFKQHFDTRYIAFCNHSPPRRLCPWNFFQNIGFSVVPSDPFMSDLDTKLGYSTGGFRLSTDCPSGAWCRGSTTCLLYVGPLFGNRLSNQSWAVGLT